MSVDLSKLSSKELFELAKQREQEEKKATERLEHLDAARKNRDKLIAEHEAAIATTDKAIAELKDKREKQLTEFEAALAPLELQISELEHEVKADQERAKQEAATVSPAKQATKPDAVAPHAATPPRPQSNTPPRTAAPAAPVSKAVAPKPMATGSSSTDDLYNLIRNMLRNRTYISESLMKEKLKAAAFDVTNLRNQLDQLIYEKRIDKKGAGNYALGKRK